MVGKTNGCWLIWGVINLMTLASNPEIYILIKNMLKNGFLGQFLELKKTLNYPWAFFKSLRNRQVGWLVLSVIISWEAGRCSILCFYRSTCSSGPHYLEIIFSFHDKKSRNLSFPLGEADIALFVVAWK